MFGRDFDDWVLLILGWFTGIVIAGTFGSLVIIGLLFARDQYNISNIKDRDVPTIEYRVDDIVVRHDEDTTYVPMAAGKSTVVVPMETEDETVLLKLHDRPGMKLGTYDLVYYDGDKPKIRLRLEDKDKIDNVTGVLYVPTKWGAIH